MAVFTNVIHEQTAATGVTIDGLLIKDGGIPMLLPRNAEIRTVAGSHLVEAIDSGRFIMITSAGSVTLPDGMPDGFQIGIARTTASAVGVTATTLLQVLTPGAGLGAVSSIAVATVVACIHLGNNEWLAIGDYN